MMPTSDSSSHPSEGQSPASSGGKPDARAAILQQAKLLFRQKGFSAVSMNDIVEMVHVKKPTIYHYFQDKETLFTEVVVEMLRHGNQLFTAGMQKGETVREKLFLLAQGYFRFSPTSVSNLVRDSQAHVCQAHRQRIMAAHHEYLVQPFIELLQSGMRSGEIREGDAEHLGLLFISLVDAMTTLNTAYESRSFDAALHARKMVEVFMDGVALKQSG